MDSFKTKVIAVVTSKGGCGKTTSIANTGGILADLGLRVLMIDADPQPTLSSWYNLTFRAEHGLKRMLFDLDIENTISNVSIKNMENATIDLVYSDEYKGEIINKLQTMADSFYRLNRVVDKIKKTNKYDIILIDTQGADTLYQSNGFIPADLVLVPIVPEMASALEIVRAVEPMMEKLSAARSVLGKGMPMVRGFYNGEHRTADSGTIIEFITQNIDDITNGGADKENKMKLYETRIPNVNAYRVACSVRLPAHLYEQKRQGPSNSARDDLLALVREINNDFNGSLFGEELCFHSDDPNKSKAAHLKMVGN